MRNFLIGLVLLFTISSCSTTKSLYYWGGGQSQATKYEALAYLNYDKQTPKSLCLLVCMYEDLMKKPGGLRQVPPPGICSEYGYLLLLPETSEIFIKNATAAQKRSFLRSDFAQYFPEYGMILLNKEMEFYPESARFLKPLIEKIRKR